MFKGLTLAITVVTLLLVGPGYIMAFTSDDYSRQCKTSIHLPCIGVK